MIKKKRTIFLIVISVVLLAAGTATWLLLSPRPAVQPAVRPVVRPAFTEKLCNGLQIGMTKSEVTTVLGGPPTGRPIRRPWGGSTMPPDHILGWNAVEIHACANDSGEIVMGFDGDDKLINKIWHPPIGSQLSN